MNNTVDLCSVLEAELANPDSGWSIGSMGAIAEFHQAAGEEVLIDDPQHLTRATTRGAIRLRVCETTRPVAYEALSPRSHRWTQGIALCLPERAVRIDRVSVLTYLGLDDEAIRPRDRDAHLFDMGLNQPQLRFCVRTHDPDFRDLLMTHCGRSLWESGNPAMDTILKSHPHRVVMSNLGRVEVYQMIGGPDTGGVSPQGPHTHLLPQLLRTARTHSANTPIPTGLLPCASLYPANPVIDPFGKDRAFNPQSFKRFQEFLKAWGPREYVQVKTALWDAVRVGGDPAMFDPPTTRLGRTAMRNALRQLARITEHENNEHGAEAVSRWRVQFDQDKPKKRVEPDSPGY